LRKCLQQEGIVSIRGGYASGKTSLIPCMASMLLNLGTLIKQEKAEKAERNKVKKYTIAELMDGDSSDDENYTGSCKLRTQFPWYQKGFKHINDSVSMDDTRQDYPKSQISDNFVTLKPIEVKEVDPPSRLLIVSPTSNGVDHILDLLTPISKQFKITRLG
jgi:hypothetical protein